MPTNHALLYQSTAASTLWCGPRPRLGWVEMPVGLSEGPSTPGHFPHTNLFFLCCSLNHRRRAARSLLEIGRLSHFFSCFSLSRLHLLILLFLLMSGNVHPNSISIFPCSVCAGNVTWRGRSVQCCTCSKWVHLKCSLQIQNSCFFWRSHTYQHCDLLLGLLQLVYLHCSIWPIWLPLCYCSTPAPPSPLNLLSLFRLLRIFSPLHPFHRLMLLAVSLHLLLLLLP